MGRGVGQANDNKLDIWPCAILFSLLFQQAFNEPDVYETGDLPEDDQAQFESVSGRFEATGFVRLQTASLVAA